MKARFDAILKPMEHDDATRIATVKDIMGELEKRAIGAGTVTFDGLDAALKRCLDSAGGRFRRVPADFELPESVSKLCVLWQCGNTSKKLPLLKMLDGRDMPTRNL
ncbi:hypothetical protein F442_16988 [Phytophthora nicotianae P10297]|uniref:Uncharacterized protein n=1 Tax=Phytophthora nicotianae P10297 TaxID=1317064 RepID=W2YIB2_PHYNI|nr:hypothetical protein F442_16988 [Phytophthora nicotianae P10297]